MNDLVQDNKHVLYPKLRDHSIMFDYSTMREGVELKKDGFIKTSKGTRLDSALCD